MVFFQKPRLRQRSSTPSFYFTDHFGRNYLRWTSVCVAPPFLWPLVTCLIPSRSSCRLQGAYGAASVLYLSPAHEREETYGTAKRGPCWYLWPYFTIERKKERERTKRRNKVYFRDAFFHKRQSLLYTYINIYFMYTINKTLCTPVALFSLTCFFFHSPIPFIYPCTRGKRFQIKTTCR